MRMKHHLLKILFKSAPKRYHLVPKKVLVTRGGKTYYTTVYVNPEQYKISKERIKQNIDELHKEAQNLLKELPNNAIILGKEKISKAGEVFEMLLANMLKSPISHFDAALEQSLQDAKFKERWKVYNDTEKKILKYNVLSTVVNLKSYAIKNNKIIITADFVGKEVGTGKKADIVVYFKDADKEAFTDLSKIQFNEQESIGISLKTKNKGEFLGLQENTFKSFVEHTKLNIKVPEDAHKNFNSRLSFHNQLLKIPRNELRAKMEAFIARSFKDDNFPDLKLLIRDFKNKETYYCDEKVIEKAFTEKFKKLDFVIVYRKDGKGISAIEWRDKNKRKIIYVQPHLKSRASITFRLNYDFVVETIKENEPRS